VVRIWIELKVILIWRLRSCHSDFKWNDDDGWRKRFAIEGGLSRYRLCNGNDGLASHTGRFMAAGTLPWTNPLGCIYGSGCCTTHAATNQSSACPAAGHASRWKSWLFRKPWCVDISMF